MVNYRNLEIFLLQFKILVLIQLCISWFFLHLQLEMSKINTLWLSSGSSSWVPLASDDAEMVVGSPVCQVGVKGQAPPTIPSNKARMREHYLWGKTEACLPHQRLLALPQCWCQESPHHLTRVDCKGPQLLCACADKVRLHLFSLEYLTGVVWLISEVFCFVKLPLS